MCNLCDTSQIERPPLLHPPPLQHTHTHTHTYTLTPNAEEGDHSSRDKHNQSGKKKAFFWWNTSELLQKCEKNNQSKVFKPRHHDIFQSPSCFLYQHYYSVLASDVLNFNSITLLVADY